MGRADNHIGRRVRAARDRLGWNRETLAVRSEISWSAIAQVEIGRRTNLRPSTLLALARALGVTVDYLVAGAAAATPMLSHSALLYETDSEFLDATVQFLAEGLERDEAVLAISSRPNIALLRRHLGPAAKDVTFVDRSRWHRKPAAALAAYRAFLGERIEAGAPWVRILGEPPTSLRTRPQLRPHACYEALLNLAFASEPVSVLCPYDTRSFDADIVAQAISTHPTVRRRDGLERNRDYADPLSLVLEP